MDVTTGGLRTVIQDPLNSSATTTLAAFNTLADLLAGCATRVRGDACDKLFAAATPPGGAVPTDTLTAAQNIARNPSHQAQELYALLDEFYPVPAGKLWREVPFVPYLSFAPERLDALAGLCRRRDELAGWHRHRWRGQHVVGQQLHAWRAVHDRGPVRRRLEDRAAGVEDRSRRSSPVAASNPAATS
ncbi:hypothetical protein ACFPJ1_28410 [Kribbella qitaiheensis]|uniref:hypothetical protein n=1 Tax=Kribbella qitaiheensis TaxID=1544730 RepID=UPI00360D65B3